jgi:hypothetical protein
MEPVPYRRSPGLRRDYERYDDQLPRGDIIRQNGHHRHSDKTHTSPSSRYYDDSRRSRQVRHIDVHRSQSDPSPRRRRDREERREILRRVEEAAIIIENPLYRDD